MCWNLEETPYNEYGDKERNCDIELESYNNDEQCLPCRACKAGGDAKFCGPDAKKWCDDNCKRFVLCDFKVETKLTKNE